VFKAKVMGVEGFERIVALKRILPHIARREFITMFIDEAKIAVQLQQREHRPDLRSRQGGRGVLHRPRIRHGAICAASSTTCTGTPRPCPAAGVLRHHGRFAKGWTYAHNKPRPRAGAQISSTATLSPQNVLIGYEGEVQAHRLRHRPGGRQGIQDPGGNSQRQVRLHVARAGARTAHRPAQRHLRPGNHSLRDATGQRLFVARAIIRP